MPVAAEARLRSRSSLGRGLLVRAVSETAEEVETRRGVVVPRGVDVPDAVAALGTTIEDDPDALGVTGGMVRPMPGRAAGRGAAAGGLERARAWPSAELDGMIGAEIGGPGTSSGGASTDAGIAIGANEEGLSVAGGAGAS